MSNVSSNSTESVDAQKRKLLSSEEAAEYLRLSSNTLRRWRWLGIGPKYAKVGGRVVYRLADLDGYIAAGICETIERVAK